MGGACNMCSRAINKKCPGVKCGICASEFHSLCANISEEQQKILQEDFIVWYCIKCRSRPACSASAGPKEPSKNNLSFLINSLRDEILNELNSKFNALLESVNFCSNKITDFENKLKDTDEKLKLLDKYKEENNELKSKVSELDKKVHDLEQYSRINNIIISNCAESRNENIFDVISEISTKIGINLKDGDVDTAHRLQSNNKSGTMARNIVVKFNSRRMKDNFLTAYRHKKKDLHQVFITEHLSHRNAMLLKNAKETLRPKNFKYIWTRNCKIFVRKDDTSRIHLIQHNDDINKLC